MLMPAHVHFKCEGVGQISQGTLSFVMGVSARFGEPRGQHEYDTPMVTSKTANSGTCNSMSNLRSKYLVPVSSRGSIEHV